MPGVPFVKLELLVPLPGMMEPMFVPPPDPFIGNWTAPAWIKYATFVVGSAAKDEVRVSQDGSVKFVLNWTMYVSLEALGHVNTTFEDWSDA